MLYFYFLFFFFQDTPSAETPSDHYTLTVRFENLKRAEGKMISCVTTDKEKFLYHPDICEGARITTLNDVVINFKELKKGDYALTAFQDENGNDKMDYNIFRMPKESFGFSKDPKLIFGPPDFKEVLIPVYSDTTIVVTMKHL